ncbi:MAG TPA: universal stress protein [Devosia sp.]|nr:universal stress protein [Devosia sp.]
MIKNIAVHLTGSSEDDIRLAYAGALAERCNASITGLQVNVMPAIVSITDPTGSAFLQQLIATSNQQAEVTGERLGKQLARLGSPSELRRLDIFPDEVGITLATEARLADLFVGTRPYGDPAKTEATEEAVLLRSGRPCIFLPPDMQKAPKFDSIVVGWKNTREAARAVADALPLLQQADRVDVIKVAEEASPPASAPGVDIGRYLSRHGVKTEIRTAASDPDTGTALLREARASAADLIVIGGYGHSRLREWALGGATRELLSNAPVPVFISH